MQFGKSKFCKCKNSVKYPIRYTRLKVPNQIIFKMITKSLISLILVRTVFKYMKEDGKKK